MARYVPGYNETPKKHVEISVEDLDEGVTDRRLDWYK
jgi:hypothetical protein